MPALSVCHPVFAAVFKFADFFYKKNNIMLDRILYMI